MVENATTNINAAMTNVIRKIHFMGTSWNIGVKNILDVVG
jgi:hypothetical protein